MKKASIILCFIICLSSCIIEQNKPFFKSQTYNSCTFSEDPLTGASVRWKKERFPISFYVHESAPIEAYYNFASALEYWNLAWIEYLDEKGVKSPPLFTLVGENELFSASPKRDGYNVLFFTDNFGRYYTQQSPQKTQAVTVVRRTGSEIKDADIIVNQAYFKFFYDRDYDEDIRLASQKKLSIRNLASSRDLTLIESIKLKLLSFFKSFVRLLKRDILPVRSLSARKPRVPKGFIDFPSLMIHELGHVPGLFHSDDERVEVALRNSGRASSSSRDGRRSTKSVMEIKLPSGFARRTISNFDLDNLYCAYYEGR